MNEHDIRKQDDEATQLMERIVRHVKIYHTFYGALCERLKLKLDRRHPTMYTDAVVIGYNPAFVMTQRYEHAAYIVIHEITHCALGHPFRRGNRDPKTWNEAIDHAVNLTLNKDPELAKMFPPDGLADQRFTNMAAEQIYSILWAEKQQQGDEQGDEQQELDGASGMAGDCCDAGASGEPMPSNSDNEDGEGDDDSDDDSAKGKGSADDEDGDDADDDAQGGGSDDDSDDDSDDEQDDDADGDGSDGSDDSDESSDERDDEAGEGGERDMQDASDAEAVDGNQSQINATKPEADAAQKAQLERDWTQAVMTAQLAAGGDIEASMARAIGNANIERKDFRAYVDEFAHATCSMEDSWARPNRRYSNEYLPARCAPGVKVMVVGIDTSGSVTAGDLANMQQAAQGVLDDFGLKEMHVVYCDTRIRGTTVFYPGDVVTLEAKGGGGTYFHPVLRYALELQQGGEDVAGVIYCTDLMGSVSDPEDFAALNVLWVDVTKYGAKYNRDAPDNVGRVVSVYA